MKHGQLGVVLAGLLLATGCGDQDDRFGTAGTLAGPYVVGEGIVLHDSAMGEVVLASFDAEGNEPRFERVAAPDGAGVVMELSDRGALVFQNKATNLITIVYPQEKEFLEYEAEAPFNKFVYFPEESIIACYFDDTASSYGKQLLNHGLVAFIDLTTNSAIEHHVLPTYGGAPLGIHVAPRVDGKALAVVRWRSFLSIVDALDATGQEVSVPIKAPNVLDDIYPGAVKFQVEGKVLQARFLDVQRGDLYQISIDVQSLGPDGEGVLPNIFPTMPGATAFEPFLTEDGTTALLVVSSVKSVVAVVHPDTSAVEQYPIDGLVSRIQIFDDASYSSTATIPWALLTDRSSYTYYVVELTQLTEKKSKAFRKFALPGPADKVYPLPGGERFLAIHGEYYSDTPLSVIQTVDGSAISLGGQIKIKSEYMNEDSSTIYLVVSDYYYYSSGSSIIALDTKLLTQRTFESPGFAISSVHPLGSSPWLLLRGESSDDFLLLRRDFEGPEDALWVSGLRLFGLVD